MMRILLLSTLTTLASLVAAFVPVSTTASHRVASSLLATRMNDMNSNLQWSTPNAIGEDWEGHWESKYRQLKAEKSYSPKGMISYMENPKLWDWLHIQKENLRRGVMRQDRREKLAELGYAVETGPLASIAPYIFTPPPTKAFRSTKDVFPPKAPPVTTSRSSLWNDM